MKIKNLESYGENGYIWSEERESDVSNEVEASQYRTNRDGEGLWTRKREGQDWRQISGTCQFNLHVKDVRGKIRRESQF